MHTTAPDSREEERGSLQYGNKMRPAWLCILTPFFVGPSLSYLARTGRVTKFTMSPVNLILLSLLGVITGALAVGINCDGSPLCLLATLEQAANRVEVIQAFRSAMKYTDLPGTTAYYESNHIICISNELSLILGPNIGPARLGVNIGLKTGGICMFPENLPRGTSITLTQARNFTEQILGRGCTTCGAVPIGYPRTNNVANGQLKIDYVAKPICTGDCIWQNNHQPSTSRISTTTAAAVVVTSTVPTTRTVTATQSTSSSVPTSTSSRTSTLPTGPSTSTRSPTSTVAQFASTAPAQATVTVTASVGALTSYSPVVGLAMLLAAGMLVYSLTL